MSEPRSIVLGARAYGARVSAMRSAFDDHARVAHPRPSRSLSTWVATVRHLVARLRGLGSSS